MSLWPVLSEIQIGLKEIFHKSLIIAEQQVQLSIILKIDRTITTEEKIELDEMRE